MGDADLLVPVTPDADKLLAIVRRLAEMAPWDNDAEEYTLCHFCGVEWGSDHWDTCLYQNAKEVLDAQA